jgi:hypothetical protein
MANKFLKSVVEKYEPNSRAGDEQAFLDKHVVAEYDPANVKGNVLDPSLEHVGTIDRNKDNHGYNPGEDDAVNEELLTDEELTVEEILDSMQEEFEEGELEELKEMLETEEGYDDILNTIYEIFEEEWELTDSEEIN